MQLTSKNKSSFPLITSKSSSDFKSAIAELEKALINYKMRQGIESSCHSKCEYSDVQATKFDDEGLDLNWMGDEDVEDLHFIRLLERTTCLKDCFAEHPFSRILRGPEIDLDVKDEFESYNLYNFLQISYHQIGEGRKAANAAYTYLSHNPNDDEMKQNLEFYKYHYPEVEQIASKQQLVDVELPNYNKLFQKGVIAYESQNFGECISSFEKALLGYYSALDECEKLCFSTPNQMDRFPLFWRSVADFELKSTICKKKCQQKVAAEAYNKRFDEPVSMMLQYLQFCYYSTGELMEAANAVKSGLLLNPSDQVAKQNSAFYAEKLGASGDQTQYRKDVVRYLQKKKHMENLIYFGNKFLRYEDEDNVQENATEEEFPVTKEKIREAIKFEDIEF